jgi:hypothetical protein
MDEMDDFKELSNKAWNGMIARRNPAVAQNFFGKSSFVAFLREKRQYGGSSGGGSAPVAGGGASAGGSSSCNCAAKVFLQIIN